MESVELRIEKGCTLGGTMYRLNVAFEASQCSVVCVDQYMSQVPREYIARHMVDQVVADIRARLLKKVLSVQ